MPKAPWHNAVLQNEAEADAARQQVRSLGLEPHKDLPKNWDALGAVDAVLRATETSERVLDAGGTKYSTIAPWLWRYGYRRLTVVNLTFKRSSPLGSIRYQPGDLTDTGLPSGSLGAMTCMSVIEHGVDLGAYFAEAARLLRPGGVLVTSTDFHPDPPDTEGKEAYGVPIHIFDTSALEAAIADAGGHGLEPTGPFAVGSPGRPVRWERHGLSYTFALFTLRRTA